LANIASKAEKNLELMLGQPELHYRLTSIFRPRCEFMPSAQRTTFFSLVVVMIVGCTVTSPSQQISKADRDFTQQMLRNVGADVTKFYYDPKLHGVDWDAKVRQARENIDKADSMDSAVSEIAALLDTLNDSHTAFLLPPRNYVHKYGFTLKMIGDRCYVTRVYSGSDAEKKGLQRGDQILAVNDLPVTRKTFWKVRYIFQTLRPQPGLRLTLLDEGVNQRQLDAMAKLEPASVIKYRLHQGINQMVQDWTVEYELLQPQYFEKGDEFLAVRIPAFSLSAEEVDRVIGKMRKHKGVVLDLRGNLGGFTETLGRLVGGMFENGLKIYDRVQRDSTKSVSVEGRHKDAFTGRLAVLVDSGSASASELFARIIQLEKRGFVMGDRSAGMVMEARLYPHEISLDTDNFYGAQITTSDLIMTDGKRLEHVGVEPDILILPTAHDLSSRRDPLMAKAAALVGFKVTPEDAGSMFPEK
jgi:carboxyl-terminal processing protease